MAPVQEITAAERIRELSDINHDVAAMLGAAGQSIHALTNRPLHSDDTAMDQGPDDTLKARQKAFEKNSIEFLEGLQAVAARLRRQAYALQEAGITTPDPFAAGSAPAQDARALQQAMVQRGPNNAPKIPPTQRLDPERIKNGGLGNFDVGWLNSRGNKVGAEKEAELIQEAKELLASVRAGNQSLT